MQSDWRWCNKCQGLAFSLNQLSVCPAGGSHDHTGSGNYALVLDDPSAPGQSGWKWCMNCQGLAFAEGLVSPSFCPTGGSHDHSASGNYTLAHNDPSAPGQSDWRWCQKCQGLAFSLNQPSVCPAGGSHDHSGSGNYTIASADDVTTVAHSFASGSNDVSTSSIDAIVYWPPTNRAYFFRGSDYVRYRLGQGESAEEKASLRQHYWKGLAFEDRIDAASTVGPEELVYFFRGGMYVPYRVSAVAAQERALDQPRPIVNRYPNLPPKYQQDLDAVLYWPSNGRLYFFKKDLYLACDANTGAPLQHERKIAEGWRGVNFDRIDAAFLGNVGKAYFFRGDQYVVYSVAGDKATGPARPWKDYWDDGRLWTMLQTSPTELESPDSVLEVQSRLAFWQDLDATSYEAGRAAVAREERIGFANLATMQAGRMRAFTDGRHYQGRQVGQIGPTAFRAGRDIIESIVNAHGATGRKVDQIHVFGHSNGANGLYGEDHVKQTGLYRSSFKPWRDNTTDSEEIHARVISEIPKEDLALDVVFVLHGCKMAEGGDSFARELCTFLTTGQPLLADASVYAHAHSAACGQNRDWIRYSQAKPNGQPATMPADIYHEFTLAENVAVDVVSRTVFAR